MRSIRLATVLCFAIALTCAAADWDTQRAKLVEVVKAQGVTDAKVLAALGKTPRHLFVPESVRAHAYRDTPLPIGLEQTISQPFIVGFMTQALELKGGEKVLEIGTGSGYQAAILGEIAKDVFTIEILCDLATQADKRLSELGYKNIHVKCGDGYQGWPAEAPFDAVMVTAAPEKVPQPLLDQLKVGGRMVIPVGKNSQELRVLTKAAKGVESRSVLPVIFVPMTGPGVREK